ncbi:MAG TPA: hypothetical protein VHZ55_18035 [Bryobacteraceae bacterium]|jgi:outer membrane lipoprotein-sorting protein|nr:hypothetical protein [Bryobacteraceae bacterium]
MERFELESKTERLSVALKPIRLLVVLSLSVCGGLAADNSTTFTGEIMDRMCAQMHSHDNMMKSEGASNAKECALKCVKNGDKVALFDSASNNVYVIEDSKKVEPFAGQRVRITGSYDKDSEVLTVKSISAAK